MVSGDAEPQTMSLLPGAEAEEAERRKETMELFPQSAGFGVKDAARYVQYFSRSHHVFYFVLAF